MTHDELRALADALEPMARAPRFEDFDVPGFCEWVRACADAKPVGYVTANGLRMLKQDDATVLLYAHDYLIRPDQVPLYAHPAPVVPQAEPIDPHMIVAKDRFPDEQAEPKREPLSDDEILDILDIATAADLRFSMYSDDVETRAAIKRLARAVERAHGIGSSDE